MEEEIRTKPYINNVMQLLTNTSFSEDQIKQLENLHRHLEDEIKRLRVGMICDEYIEGINLEEVHNEIH